MQFEYRTVENLARAFIRKTQNTSLLSFYADKASRSGYEIIKDTLKIFENYEKIHAEIFYIRLLDNFNAESELKNILLDNVEVNLSTLEVSDDLLNLINIEERAAEFYQDASVDAENEGFLEISKLFKYVATVSLRIADELQVLYDEVKADVVFVKEDVNKWLCSKCGYLHLSSQAPEICPLCKQAKANFYVEK